MAIARVGASQANTGNPSSFLELTRTPTTVGNIMIVGANVFGPPTVSPSVTDTQSHTWLPLNPWFSDSVNTTGIRSWYTLAKNTSSTTVRVTNNGTAEFMFISLEEFSGGPFVIDKVLNSGRGKSGTPTSPSFTPTYNDELIWAFCPDTITAVGNIDGSAATKGSDDGVGDWTEHRILSGRAGISMTAALAGTGAYNLQVATIAPAPAQIFPHRRMVPTQRM